VDHAGDLASGMIW